MLHRYLKLMWSSISVFSFQQMSMAKRKLTNVKLFANTAVMVVSSIWEIYSIKHERAFGTSSPTKAPIIKLQPRRATLKEAHGAPLPQNNLSAVEITRCIREYNNKGFWRLVNILEPKYTIPSWPVTECYQLCTKSLKEAECISLPKEGWASQAAHVLTSECEVQLKLKTDWIQKINAVHGLFSPVAFQYHSKYGMIGTANVDFLSWY